MIIFFILIYRSFEDQIEIVIKRKLPSVPLKNKLEKCKVRDIWLGGVCIWQKESKLAER